MNIKSYNSIYFIVVKSRSKAESILKSNHFGFPCFSNQLFKSSNRSDFFSCSVGDHDGPNLKHDDTYDQGRTKWRNCRYFRYVPLML